VRPPEILMEGVVFGESPRWHDGRLWFSDWGANQVIALGTDGSHEVVVTVPSFPMCIDFLPDGRLLIVDSAQRRLLRREPDGLLVPHTELSEVSEKPWNDIVVDDRGNAYVNPSVSTSPAASSRRAWSCSLPRKAPSVGSPTTSRSRTVWRSPRTALRWSLPSHTPTVACW
jgi:sugar lactone lactonase YvrE